MMTLTIHEPTAMEPVQPFDELQALALQTVAPSSARVYGQTYGRWRAWCAQDGTAPLDLRPVTVLSFLWGQNATKATRQRQLSALRKLAQMLYILNPTEDTRRIHEALKVVKAPTTEQNGQERTKRALAPAQADKVLRAWDLPCNAHRRNRALIAVLALGALRRSEAAALQWRDIDFENGVITVRHGKGDKAREVPLAGEFALDALFDWQMWACCAGDLQGRCDPAHTLPRRVFVFCPMERGDHLGKDQTIRGTDVYR